MSHSLFNYAIIFIMNISMPLLTKKPIDLLNVKCQRVMDKMKSEFSPQKD